MGTVVIPQNLPVGYRFHPTDEEFVDHYLKNRVRGYVDRPCIIPDVNICTWDPWELPHKFHGESIIPPDDKVQEWWFFCRQTPQPGRSTPSGFWKKTGQDREVKDRDTNRVIGAKKTLVFHKGRGSKGISTKWVIHEFHLLANELNRNYVLCWLKHTRDEKADNSTIEFVHGAINLADLDLDLDLDLHEPDHEDSFPEPLIQAMMNSLIEPPFHTENRVSSDLLQLLQPAGRSQNSLPPNINQFMIAETEFPLENRFQPENQVSSDMLQLFQPSRRSQNSLPSNIDQFVYTEGQNQFVCTDSFMDSSLENSIVDESVQSESLFGTSEEDEIFGNMPNDDLFEEVEAVEVPSGDSFFDDFFDGDQMQTEHFGQASHSHDERPVVMENRRSQTMSVRGVLPIDKKKGMVENKFNGALVAPEKYVAPLVCAGSVKSCSKDEEPTSGKVKQEAATKNIKPERISLDEAAATAKVLTYKERGSAGNSPKKTDSKEIEHARKKSKSVTALTGPTTVSKKSFTSPQLLNLMNMLVGILLLNAIAKYFISDFHCRFAP